MLSWIKRRVREFEGFDWMMGEDLPPSRKEYIKAAIEDYQWMRGQWSTPV